ncbi:MAG: helix-turn-helix transcriptional regulator [Candidatus Omnitrophica bacterium]|nr:helix-turn-helix transcriptional regulator [Candidatus Omnitrophota bacterium]
MKKESNKSLFEKKMADRKFREKFEREYPVFELEVQVLSAIEKKGWTLSQLAKAMGTSKSNISRDLNSGGIKTATISRIARMAKTLDYDFVPLLIPRNKEGKFLSELQKLIAA